MHRIIEAPQAWLADVLTRIVAHPIHRLERVAALELDAGISTLRPSGMTIPVNKVHEMTIPAAAAPATCDRCVDQAGASGIAGTCAV
jgi:hypothetical protein